jgi:hypothetical protein
LLCQLRPASSPIPSADYLAELTVACPALVVCGQWNKMTREARSTSWPAFFKTQAARPHPERVRDSQTKRRTSFSAFLARPASFFAFPPLFGGMLYEHLEMIEESAEVMPAAQGLDEGQHVMMWM